MHLKNFSLINSGYSWSLASAYDLLNVSIANPDDNEELALTLEGKKKKLKRDHFERFGKLLGLNDRQINGAFNRFNKNKSVAFSWIDQSFLTSGFKGKYVLVLEERYTRLFAD